MVRVSIEYCAPCRDGDDAVSTQRVLADRLRKYDEVEEVSLTPIEEDLFSVTVDGESVWSANGDGRVDPMEALAAVRSRLSTP